MYITRIIRDFVGVASLKLRLPDDILACSMQSRHKVLASSSKKFNHRIPSPFSLACKPYVCRIFYVMVVFFITPTLSTVKKNMQEDDSRIRPAAAASFSCTFQIVHRSKVQTVAGSWIDGSIVLFLTKSLSLHYYAR